MEHHPNLWEEGQLLPVSKHLGCSRQPLPLEKRQQLLLTTIAHLHGAKSVGELVAILRGCARALAASDGMTIVHREQDEVRYVAEDAIAPLWAGQTHPIHSCIAGLAMLQNEPVLIPDIYADDRVPHAAYKRTFVRSMAMFPIGTDQPEWAIGAYWAKAGSIAPDSISLLSRLARSAAVAFDRVGKPIAPQSPGEAPVRAETPVSEPRARSAP